jgi:hypothetical protein
MKQLSPQLASEFCRIALGHVALEYPHYAGEVLMSPAELTISGPRFHPIFYGSYDWHSCVHGYWLLSRLNRLFPDLPQRAQIIAQLDQAFVPEKVAGETAFFARPYSEDFERPYGWAWLLKLNAELLQYKDEAGQRWGQALLPLAKDLARRLGLYFQRLANPVRGGAHSNSAFSLALTYDYARAVNDTALIEVMRQSALRWFGEDVAPTRHDFGGTDFLSPAITTAEAMRRLLPADAFNGWFRRFMPDLAAGEPAFLLQPQIVTDRSDGHLAHLDGLNLSRAWAMRNLARAVPAGDPRADVLLKAADATLAEGLDKVEGNYVSTHWVATYALLALEAGQEEK